MQSCLLDRHSTAVYNQPILLLMAGKRTHRAGACFRHAVVMLYCAAMVDRQDALARLIARFRGTGIGNILAVMLDAAGPLAPLGAQAIYTLDPFLSVEGSDWHSLGQALEDPDRLEELIQALRGMEGEGT